MANIGRHFCVDFHSCHIEFLNNSEKIIETLLLAGNQLGSIESPPMLHASDKKTQAIVFIDDNRLTINTFPKIGYVAIDIFCMGANPTPQKAISIMKAVFKPEKVRTTSVRRGDFGSEKDMKPKIRTKAGPMRRIKETGNKMLSALKKKKSRTKQ